MLTSLDAGALRVGLDVNVEYQVQPARHRCGEGWPARARFVSPQEVVQAPPDSLRPPMQLVTPGIRTGAEKADDQKRTLTPKEAMDPPEPTGW